MRPTSRRIPRATKINPAQKPEALAQHFCHHHIPVGGTILIIGAGAGGSVFGALRSGVNVVAVENDNFQFEMFKRTFLAKQQAEFDKIDGKSEEEDEEVPATQPLQPEKSGQPAPIPAPGLPSPPAQRCDCCEKISPRMTSQPTHAVLSVPGFRATCVQNAPPTSRYGQPVVVQNPSHPTQHRIPNFLTRFQLFSAYFHVISCINCVYLPLKTVVFLIPDIKRNIFLTTFKKFFL